MRRFLPYIASLLLALWLPATQHCGMEQAGLIPEELPHEASALCCDLSGPCTHDACSIVEAGLIKSSVGPFKVIAPDLVSGVVLWVSLFALPDSLEPLAVAAPIERPLDWVSSWHFVRRAAPLSRAPSLVG